MGGVEKFAITQPIAFAARPRAVVALSFEEALTELPETPPGSDFDYGDRQWRRGALEFLAAMAGANVRCWIFTVYTPWVEALPGDAEEFFATGGTPFIAGVRWGLLEEYRAMARAAGVSDDAWWEGPGLPEADAVVTDAAAGDLFRVAAELGVRLVA